ncbi:MAG: MATE family efflux transporter [Cyanobacteria bacterium J007]|nr:MAG: MATE family efflux transporter [Cyanobacteria bacterium J007]
MERIAVKSPILSEIKACLQLSIPLAAAQLAQASTNFVDTIVMGWLGSERLAAGALGSISFSTLFLIGTGLLSSVGAMAAVAYGAKEYKKIGRIAEQGLWLGMGVSIPIAIVIWNFAAIAVHFGQNPETVAIAQTYLRAIVWGFPGAIGFIVLRNIYSAIHRPNMILAIVIGSVPINVVGNYVLMFGKFGFPELGLAGIGWASTFSFWAAFLAAVAVLKLKTEFEPYRIFATLRRFHPPVFWEIVQIGWPSGILLAIEAGLFTVTTYLMGYLGTVPLAAHYVALQTASITFMVPVGISYATTMRVGHELGRKDRQGSKRAGSVGMGIGGLFMAVMAVCVWQFPRSIVGVYLDLNNPENSAVVELAISLLGIAAFFQIFDGVQVIAAGALRGLKDTRIPMAIGLFSYWGVGLVSAYWMAFKLGWGSLGLWWGWVLGLGVAALILPWRFYALISDKFEGETARSQGVLELKTGGDRTLEIE